MPSFLSSLQSLLSAELEEQNALKLKIESAFLRMSALLPFKTMGHLHTFFHRTDFQTSRSIDTFYGSLKVCPVSDRLLQLFLKDNCTLQRLSALFLPQSPAIINEMDDLFKFRELLVTLVLTNFYVFWFPMVHTDYINHECAAESLESVRIFLSDLHVFECLFDFAREEQQFIYSWMQNLWISDNDEKPPWKLHRISDRLVANIQKTFYSCLGDSTTFFSAVKLSLKVSKFLFDASEFVYSFQVSQATFNSIQSFSLINPKLECTSIRYQYEALCVMLQSMNAYSMYLEPEHMQIFYEAAPQLLRRINRLGLNLVRDTEEERELLTSLPRIDLSNGFRRDVSSFSSSPTAMEEIDFNSSFRFNFVSIYLL